MTHQVGRFGLDGITRRRLACLSLFWRFLDPVWICVFTSVHLPAPRRHRLAHGAPAALQHADARLRVDRQRHQTILEKRSREALSRR